MRVDIERIVELENEIRSINQLTFDEIELYKDGKVFNPTPKQLSQLKLFLDTFSNTRGIANFAAYNEF